MKSVIELYQGLFDDLKLYEKLHNRTGETDKKIMQLLLNGSTINQAAEQVPCSESTVSDAKKRVEVFLDNELPEYRDILEESFYIHNSIARGRYYLNPQVHKLYCFLVNAHQNFKARVEGKIVHTYIPGLRNRAQRKNALSELNNLVVVLDEVPNRSVKIFEYVNYDKAEYSFEFTEEALPYYDKFYALLKMMGMDFDLELND